MKAHKHHIHKGKRPQARWKREKRLYKLWAMRNRIRGDGPTLEEMLIRFRV